MGRIQQVYKLKRKIKSSSVNRLHLHPVYGSDTSPLCGYHSKVKQNYTE